MAVIGHLQTHTLDPDGPHQRKAGDLLKSAFPAVIDKATWNRVRALREARQPRGRHADRTDVRNVLAGLVTCGACGGTVTRVTTLRPYLVCSRSKQGLCVPRRSTRYDHLETVLLANLPSVLHELPAGAKLTDALHAELESVESAQLHIGDVLEKLLDALEREPASQAIRNRLREQEAQQGALAERAASLREQAEQSLGPLVESRRRDALAALNAKPLDRGKLNVALRQLASGVVIDWETATLSFTWRHTARESSVMFSLPGTRRKKRRYTRRTGTRGK